MGIMKRIKLLIKKSSFLTGFSHTLDIFPAQDLFDEIESLHKSDSEMIAQAWNAVGSDLKDAIKSYKAEAHYVGSQAH